MNQNKIYNTIGKTYDITRKPDAEIVRTLIQLLDSIPKGRYLDIGCGSGNYTGVLAMNGLNIEGIDISYISQHKKGKFLINQAFS